MSKTREQLIEDIKQVIKPNNKQQITGQVLQNVLVDMTDNLVLIDDLPDILIAVYGQTTSGKVKDAIDDDKAVVCIVDVNGEKYLLQLEDFTPERYHFSTYLSNDIVIECWLENDESRNPHWSGVDVMSAIAADAEIDALFDGPTPPEPESSSSEDEPSSDNSIYLYEFDEEEYNEPYSYIDESHDILLSDDLRNMSAEDFSLDINVLWYSGMNDEWKIMPLYRNYYIHSDTNLVDIFPQSWVDRDMDCGITLNFNTKKWQIKYFD